MEAILTNKTYEITFEKLKEILDLRNNEEIIQIENCRIDILTKNKFENGIRIITRC